MKNIYKFMAMVIFSSSMAVQSAEFESNVAIANDYVWRGMTQTSEEPAISGGFDIAGESGLYFGTWASNVEFGDGAALELDWYAGYANELENGLSYDIGYLAFTYPGEDSLDFEEIYLGLGYSYFGLTYSAGQDSAPDNTEFSVALGETGLGVTYGDYDEYGEYTIISYDLPMSIAGLGVSLSWSDFSAETSSGLADEDTFVITFSM
ncbi:TorF family putative porin [Gammaproteobacteria bacterium]|nr:TorF family putative porin [Gammaproteobacteria bacterium]